MNKTYKTLTIIMIILSLAGLFLIFKTDFRKIYYYSLIKTTVSLEKHLNKQKTQNKPLFPKQKNINKEKIVQKISEDASIIIKNDKYGIINKDGKTIIPPKYDNIRLINNYYIVEKRNKEYTFNGLYDKNGKQIAPAKYTSIYFKNDEFILLWKNQNFKLYSKTKNKYMFSTYAEDIPIVIKNNIFAVLQKGKFIIIDEKGRRLIKREYDYLGCTRYKPAITTDNDTLYFRIKKNNKWGIIDIKGNEIIPITYDGLITSIEKDKIYVKKENLWGIINYNNEVLHDFTFDYIPTPLGTDFYIKKISSNELNKDTEEQFTPNIEVKPFYGIKDRKPIYYGNGTSIETPKPFIEKREEDTLQIDETADLYVLSVYESSRIIRNVKPPQTNPRLGEIDIQIENQPKPIVLLLTSYEPVIWKVKTDSKSIIKKIYFSGYYDGDVITQTKQIPIEKLNKRVYFNDKEKEKIKKLIGKDPQFFQYKYYGDYFIINNKSVSEQKVYENFSTDKEVKFSCFKNMLHDCKLTKNGLYLEFIKDYVYSLAYTNKYYSKGKYYYEMQIKIPENEKRTFANAGITSHKYNTENKLCDFQLANTKYQYKNCNTYGIHNFSKMNVVNNDIFGFAVDLDNGKLFISHNGNWITGSPETNVTNIPIDIENKEYTASAQTGNSIGWLANFGATKFKYPIPKGYKPYDTYSANKNKVNI